MSSFRVLHLAAFPICRLGELLQRSASPLQADSLPGSSTPRSGNDEAIYGLQLLLGSRHCFYLAQDGLVVLRASGRTAPVYCNLRDHRFDSAGNWNTERFGPTARIARSDDNRAYPYGRGIGFRLFGHACQQSQVASARRLSVDDVFRSICRSSTAEAVSGFTARCFSRSNCVLSAGPNLPRGNAARSKLARSATLRCQGIDSQPMIEFSRDTGVPIAGPANSQPGSQQSNEFRINDFGRRSSGRIDRVSLSLN
jgi:hypothetical protein